MRNFFEDETFLRDHDCALAVARSLRLLLDALHATPASKPLQFVCVCHGLTSAHIPLSDVCDARDESLSRSLLVDGEAEEANS